MTILMRFAQRPIDNISLVLFRICYGFLVACEAFGAIATGWVKRVFIEPQFTFNFIGFDFLQPLPGDGMYYYFILMGICGLMIMLGYRYRLAAFGFAVLWAGVYLMQKSSYNNHYYLLMLLGFIMALLPAHADISLDAKNRPELRTRFMPNGFRWFIILQLFIVYSYASIAKMTAGWVDLSFIEVLMASKKNLPIVGDILQQRWVHIVMAGYGLIFDLLVIPGLLWDKTRKLFFGLSVFFHLFNSLVLQIGIFPYLSLAFCLFFFPPETLRKWVRQPLHGRNTAVQLKNRIPPWGVWLGTFYLTIQLLLPLRHHLIQGDVLWTEEGHRLSWRMMLRTRAGYCTVHVKDIETERIEEINLKEHLTKKQIQKVSSYPDFAWQFAQRLKKKYENEGKQIAVFFKGKVSVNGGSYETLIDPNVDLASARWDYFRHNTWVLIPEDK